MFMVISAMLVVVGFLFIFTEYYADTAYEKRQTLMYDYGLTVQREFLMAGESGGGYRRQFIVPETLEGFNFSLSMGSNVLAVKYQDGVQYFSIPNATGQINKGANLIYNQDGKIKIN